MTMLFSVKLDKTKKMLTIRLPLERPRPSASGKTLVVASSHGCKTGEAVLCGRPIAVTANAFIFQEKPLKSSDLDSWETAEGWSERGISPARNRRRVDGGRGTPTPKGEKQAG